MTAMTLTVPETVDVAAMVAEIVTGLTDRLRDDHGYELVDPDRRAAGAATHHVYALRPRGSVIVDVNGALSVELRDVDADARDLFIAVISEIEQRHDGIHAEIG